MNHLIFQLKEQECRDSIYQHAELVSSNVYRRVEVCLSSEYLSDLSLLQPLCGIAYYTLQCKLIYVYILIAVHSCLHQSYIYIIDGQFNSA